MNLSPQLPHLQSSEQGTIRKRHSIADHNFVRDKFSLTPRDYTQLQYGHGIFQFLDLVSGRPWNI